MQRRAADAAYASARAWLGPGSAGVQDQDEVVVGGTDEYQTKWIGGAPMGADKEGIEVPNLS